MINSIVDFESGAFNQYGASNRTASGQEPEKGDCRRSRRLRASDGQSDCSPSAPAENKADTPKAAFPLLALNSPGGDGGGFHVAKGGRAQAGIQRLHDQALVGAERSRVGIRLGLPALSKPDANTGTSRGEILSVAILPLKRKRLTSCVARCIGVDNE